MYFSCSHTPQSHVEISNNKVKLSVSLVVRIVSVHARKRGLRRFIDYKNLFPIDLSQ